MWMLAVFVLFAGVAIALQIQHAKRARRNLAALAARLGLDPAIQAPADKVEFDRLAAAAGVSPATQARVGKWVAPFARDDLEGLVQGRAVRFWQYSSGNGKNRTSWIAVRVRLGAPTGLHFDLRRQGLGTSLRQMFGAKEIVVGDPGFDQAWFIETNQPDFLAVGLVPDVRVKLMAACRAGAAGVVELHGEDIVYAETGSFAQAAKLARLEAMLPAMLDLADVADVFTQTSGSGAPPAVKLPPIPKS